MGIFNFFFKKNKLPVLVRCTHCYYEFDLSPREVRLLETQNAGDICHIGFMIPVNYTDKQGKTYLFHEMKPKIKNLNPDTAIERIYGRPF